MIDPQKYCISKLNNQFDFISFNSGVKQIDDYIKKYALINQANNFSQTYVFHEKSDIIVIGYYSISNISVEQVLFPSLYTINFPNYQIPCALIGKLGVKMAYQNQGIGKYLLVDSLKKIKSLSNSIGCNAVIIDALDDDLSNYYEKFGFIRFIDKPNSLFLPIKSIP